MYRRYTDEDRQLAAAFDPAGYALLRSSIIAQLAARGIQATLPELTPVEIAAGYQGRAVSSGAESGPMLELVGTRLANKGHLRRVLALVEVVAVEQGRVIARLAGVIEVPALRTPRRIPSNEY